MVHRKIIKHKQYNMSVKKAVDIYKSMTVLQAKTQYRSYKHALKYLLDLTYKNASHTSSLQLNNRALAKALQRERETSALHLKEKLSTEALYLDLQKEYSALKAKLTSFENSLVQIHESLKNSMIPNLVRLSDDITTLKLNCDVLRNAIECSYEPDTTTTRVYPKINPTERNPRIISYANIQSPIVEEAEDETAHLAARKCKGGLCNAFNVSATRDRRANGNLPSTSGVSSNVESSRIIPDSPTIIILSPRPPTCSPAVVLRRVLTPNNSTDMNDSIHSTTVISFKDKSPSISTDDDSTISKSERKRSTHSSYFGQNEESGPSRSAFVERKKSKRSRFFKNDENEHRNKNETLKLESPILNVNFNNEDDYPKENIEPRRTKSHRKSSFRENETLVDNFSLIGERKRYRTRSWSKRSLLQSDDENSNQSTLKADDRKSLASTTFGNETSSETSFNSSRSLRTRSKNVCYKERPLNVKLRN